MWGYDSTFQKAGWHVEFEENEFGGVVDELYPPYGHPADGGVPSRWDARRDPFHTLGEEAKVNPTQLDVGDRMPLADDNWERAHQSKMKGVEGSWGDRMSFLRGAPPGAGQVPPRHRRRAQRRDVPLHQRRDLVYVVCSRMLAS